jgi:hypothetical protein
MFRNLLSTKIHGVRSSEMIILGLTQFGLVLRPGIEPRTRSDLGQTKTKNSVRVECRKVFLFGVNKLRGAAIYVC